METTQRFFRPADVARVRRNQRRIQLNRAAIIARNVLFVGMIAAGGVWAYRQTHSDERFAVRTIETTGAVHTARADIERITRRYAGMNLFRIDIARVQSDLGALSWIQRISIEKKLPDTLRILIVERAPAALVQSRGRMQYVDAEGVILGGVSPQIGDDDLPVITDAAGPELARTAAFLNALRTADAALYSRVGEIRPLAPGGFAIFDRELGATINVQATDAAEKWRALHAIARAEHLPAQAIEYADLRFAGRLVLKPRAGFDIAARSGLPVHHNVEITN